MVGNSRNYPLVRDWCVVDVIVIRRVEQLGLVKTVFTGEG